MILSISPSLYIYSNGAHNNAKRQLAEPWFGGFCSNEKRDKKLEIFGHTGDCVIAAICDEDGGNLSIFFLPRHVLSSGCAAS
jgi:hypothetical protein